MGFGLLHGKKLSHPGFLAKEHSQIENAYQQTNVFIQTT
jgi:hypothetical protein